MPVPPISDLELAAKDIVWTARKKGNLKEYTPRLIRATLEEQYHLEEGTLDVAEYKSAIKAATKAALNEVPPDENGGATESGKERLSSSRKKRKSDGFVKEHDTTRSPSTPKGKGKKKLDSGVDGVEEEMGGAKKRRKTMPKKKLVSDDEEKQDDSAPSRSKQRPKRKEESFKSAEHVPTSDMEQDEPDIGSLKLDKLKSPSREKTIAADIPPYSKQNSGPNKSKSEDEKEGPKDDDSGAKSESELSVLIDEPPKQKKKSKTGEKESKKTTAKKDGPTLSKDDEIIKRLKSLVVACGVRKVWSKVFQGLDTPQQQISKLKEILSDLGMKGRMSLEQAKAVKEKRELAQELEDVQAFAKAVERRGSATRSRTGHRLSQKEDESDTQKDKEDSDDDDSFVHPKKRSTNARTSIMAFLQDQSDDDE